MLTIYIDADACPVKDEVYRVARRYGLKVFVVSNAGMRVPTGDWLEAVVVPGVGSGVDDWIAEKVATGDIVITSDIPLAGRCLEKGSYVINPKGQTLTDDSIGNALATRALLEELRQSGAITGGPAPTCSAIQSSTAPKPGRITN